MEWRSGMLRNLRFRFDNSRGFGIDEGGETFNFDEEEWKRYQILSNFPARKKSSCSPSNPSNSIPSPSIFTCWIYQHAFVSDVFYL